MTRRGSRLGVVSFFLGAAALAIAVFIFEIETLRKHEPRDAVVLGVLDRMGLVKAPDATREISLTPAYATSINDASAFEFLRIHAWWLGLWAVGVAFFAEFRRETTLYLSAGCLLGCLSVFLLGGAVVGMAVHVGSAGVVTLLRERASRRAGQRRAEQ